MRGSCGKEIRLPGIGNAMAPADSMMNDVRKTAHFILTSGPAVCVWGAWGKWWMVLCWNMRVKNT